MHERNYTSYKCGMLAAVRATETLRTALHVRPFKLASDDAPLRRPVTSQPVNHRAAISQVGHAPAGISFSLVELSAGPLNTNADALGRMQPTEEEEERAGSRFYFAWTGQVTQCLRHRCSRRRLQQTSGTPAEAALCRCRRRRVQLQP